MQVLPEYEDIETDTWLWPQRLQQQNGTLPPAPLPTPVTQLPRNAALLLTCCGVLALACCCACILVWRRRRRGKASAETSEGKVAHSPSVHTTQSHSALYVVSTPTISIPSTSQQELPTVVCFTSSCPESQAWFWRGALWQHHSLQCRALHDTKRQRSPASRACHSGMCVSRRTQGWCAAVAQGTRCQILR